MVLSRVLRSFGFGLATTGSVFALDIPLDVQQAVRQRVADGFEVGVVIGMVEADGAVFWSHGETARGNGIAPDPTTIYEIGSITKVFTALLLAGRVAEGAFALGDPIDVLLPEGATAPTLGDAVITLEQLAMHISGLPRLPSNLRPDDDGDPYIDYDSARALAFLAAHELSRAPGSEYEYSNYAAGLLGDLLAHDLAVSYEAALRSRILDPLGLNDTAMALDDQALQRFARGDQFGAPAKSWHFDALAGAGALRSTARDMARFLAFNLGFLDGPLNALLASTHEPRFEIVPEVSVALGWHVRRGTSEQAEDSVQVWHNGATGGFTSFIGFDAGRGRGVVVLSNSTTSVDDLGFHLLNPSYPLINLERPKRRPLFAPKEDTESVQESKSDSTHENP